MNRKTEVLICGAGVAGISTAYHLAVVQGIQDILLVDERDPLSLTSDKSTECYRNWWPGGAMVAFMNRSIDLLDELALRRKNAFHLNRRGYLYATADPGRIPSMLASAEEISGLGAGPLRIYAGRSTDPEYISSSPQDLAVSPGGADLILDPGQIRRYFPYLTDHSVAVLHVRRAGWFSAQQLGRLLLEEAVANGARLMRARVEEVEVTSGRIRSVRLSGGQTIETPVFVNAAGPYLKQVGHLMGVDLPVFCEPHLKIAFNDALGVVPRDAPLLIWSDPQILPWKEEERALLLNEDSFHPLLDVFPPNVHARAEGGPGSHMLLMLWEYHNEEMEPVWPLPIDPQHAEVVLRGLSTMLPGLSAYFDRATRPFVDGGYYTKTRENRPLIGPLPVEGGYIIGALSGFGLMAALAAGELIVSHITGSKLPDYAPAFLLDRYNNPIYLDEMKRMTTSGQL